MKISTTFKAAGLVACTMLFACSPQQNNKNKSETTEMRGGKMKLGRMCRADVRQFCSSAEKGKARRQCLESNFDKLSSDCKTALEQRKKHRGGRKFQNMQNDNSNSGNSNNGNNNNGNNNSDNDDND